MRDYIFRGKTVPNPPTGETESKWVYGDYITSFWDKPAIKTEPTHNNGKTYCVDRDTVGQYTGLQDRAGNRVFDGDILKFTESETESYNCVVEWVHGGWGIFECDGEKTTFDLLDAFFLRNAEVIGNKFDNPELLGVMP